jgi:protein involved in polysaccharide export with SLBB domain
VRSVSIATLLSLTLLAVLGLPQAVTAQSSVPRDTSVTDPVSYTLRAGDVVRMRIWREPELSGDFSVDEYGRVNFPMIGTFPVTRETRESLQRKLIDAYSKSLANLSLDVIFLRRLAIVGAVKSPGLYPIDPTMTIGDAVALAGGATMEAKRTRINLIRSGRIVIENVDPAALVSQLPIQRGDQLDIPPQLNIVERNPWLPSLLIQVTAAAVTIVSILNR